MREGILGISGKTKIFGVFGDPVVHSYSPLMHNIAFKQLNINAVYLPFQIEPQHLQESIAAIRALNIVGVNITIPHKTNVVQWLDRIEGDASLTGSVNTIYNDRGVLTGYSTDGLGFIHSLKSEADWVANGQSVMLIGAGGAATAVAFRLIQEGVFKLTVLSRSKEKSKALSDLIYKRLGHQIEYGTFQQDGIREKADQYSLIINATPVGMAPEDFNNMPPFLPEWTHPEAILYDLIYNPLETCWLRRGRELGRKTLSGLGMLVYQGAEAFHIWTGEAMPVKEVYQALLEKLNNKL